MSNIWFVIALSIVSLLVVLILFKTTNEGKFIKKNNIELICSAGPKKLHISDLYIILAQFKRNLDKSMDIIDDYNCDKIYALALKSKNDIDRWVDKQKDPLFNIIIENKTKIEPENEDNRIGNISEIMSSSKSDVEENINSVETKYHIMNLSNEIKNIMSIFVNNDIIFYGIIDISSLEKLMDEIKKNNTHHVKVPRLGIVNRGNKINIKSNFMSISDVPLSKIGN